MPSRVDIINGALREVGGTRITSFEQATPNANYARDIYDTARRDLLASSEWKFAHVYVQLTASANTPAFDYDKAHVMPNDWIRTILVSDNDVGATLRDYTEGQLGSQKVIMSNSTDIYMEYVKDEEDTNLMSPKFRKALILAVARDLAIPIANSSTLKTDLTIRARNAALKAASTDSMNTAPKQRPKGSWVEVRNGWR